ncbi:MAG: alpha-amylase family glycosyl hydrolase [Opitutaceae bacterium]
MINLSEVGAAPRHDALGQWSVTFGIYLPGITFNKGYAVKVRIIHAADQFIRGIEPKDFFLDWVNGSEHDLWTATVPLAPEPLSRFGQQGTHLYRFQLQRGGEDVTLWFADPFGRAAGIGTLSAFTIDDPEPPFGWTDGDFTVSEIDDTVVYELNVREFNRDFDGAVQQLGYLADLGVNVLELMPVTNVKEDVEWGYTPIGYFAPDERLGGPNGLKRLVNAAHAHGIAVILDAVYAHAHPEFAYNLVYETSGEPNPMMGYFAGEFFGDRPGTDYGRAFTRDFFLQLNAYLLSEYHVDGFRYDYVPGMWDGPAGEGYAKLVHDTHQLSKAMPRFDAGGGRSRIIQCAEHLPDPAGVLSTTYTNCAWQNGLLDKARDMARWNYVDADFGHRLDPQFIGYPESYINPSNGDTFPVAPFQYIESHDHGRFINEFGRQALRDLLGEAYGDRSRFYRMQPFIIALYTAKGIPMLWAGQEFGENWGVPHGGFGRNLFERPLHWEFFYDRAGKALVRLHRILGSLRRNLRALKSRGSFFYVDDPNHRAQRAVVFRREAPAAAPLEAESVIVALNFSEAASTIWIPFPAAGNWVEQIDDTHPPVEIAEAGQWMPVQVSGSYGAIFLRQ